MKGEERARRKTDVRRAMLDQLSLMADEAESLGSLLGAMPDEFLHGRPIEGMPSIADLLSSIGERDRTVRLDNLRAFMSGDDLTSEETVEAPDTSDTSIADILADLRSERLKLVTLAEEVAEAHWDRTVFMEGRPVKPLEYLSALVQSDAAALRQIAERVFESRPMGSPGLSRH